MRISSRVMTGAFSSMSMVGILCSLLPRFYGLRLLPSCIRQPAGLSDEVLPLPRFYCIGIRVATYELP
jgi:hypothetical protein